MQSHLSSQSGVYPMFTTGARKSACRWGRVVVISPHLDDAVFSCGALLADFESPLTLTVFAGAPPSDLPLTDWDASCGFVSAQQALFCRKQEDVSANQILGARVQHLSFLDAQYGVEQDLADIVGAVADVLVHEQADTVLFPLGLFHADHSLVHDSMMVLRQHYRGLCWIAYEDALYRRKPGLLRDKLLKLNNDKQVLNPFCVDTSPNFLRKQQAVMAYASQLAGIGLAEIGRIPAAQNDTAAPEGFWLFG